MIAAFISYSSRDLEAVQVVRQQLTSAGLASFVDFESFGRVSDWEQRVRREIETHAGFLAVVSAAYMSSPQCQMELAHAREVKKPLIAVLVEERPRTELSDFVSIELLAGVPPSLSSTAAALCSIVEAPPNCG